MPQQAVQETPGGIKTIPASPGSNRRPGKTGPINVAGDRCELGGVNTLSGRVTREMKHNFITPCDAGGFGTIEAGLAG
jgi:hypothetical protein